MRTDRAMKLIDNAVVRLVEQRAKISPEAVAREVYLEEHGLRGDTDNPDHPDHPEFEQWGRDWWFVFIEHAAAEYLDEVERRQSGEG